MTSLRRRLFLLLISATAAIWLCAVGWIYFENRAAVTLLRTACAALL